MVSISIPAAAVKEHGHEIARRDGRAGANVASSKHSLCSIVGPDEIRRGIQVVEALCRSLLHVDTQLLIEAVACAERRLVVAEEHEHDRLGVVAERVDVGSKLLSGAGHAAEIVVHGVVGRIGDAFVRDVGLAPDEGVVRIGAVALIADTEREARLRGIARFPAFGPLGEECLVVRVAVQTVFVRQQIFVVAIEEMVCLEAEALVDLFAAV